MQRISGAADVPVDARPVAETDAVARRAGLVERLGLTPELVRFAVGLFAATRVCYVLLTLVALQLRISSPRPTSLLAAWYRFDANFYARLALNGYQSSLAYRANFFPLQPLLAHLAAPLTGGDTGLSSLLVANVACLVAMLGLAALANDLFGERTARHALLFFALYPAAFFLFAGYAEAALLAFATWSVVAMRRGNWWLAGLLGLCAALARNAGVLLAIPFAAEYLARHGWRLRKVRADALWGLLIPCGLLIFMGVLYVSIGDPLAFLHTQSTAFHHTFSPSPATVLSAFPALSLAPDRIFLIRDMVDLACVLGFAALIVLGARRLPLGLTLYFAVVWVLSTSYREPLWPLESGARYMLAAFPGFLVLAIITERRPRLRIALLAASGVALMVLAQFFVRGAVIL
jgi:hypothetical protein